MYFFFLRKLYCIIGNKLQFHTRRTQGTQEVQQKADSHENLTKRFIVQANWRELPSFCNKAGRRGNQWQQLPFRAWDLLYIPPALTFRNCVQPTMHLCFVWISEQTAIISLYSIKLPVFITEAECLLRGTDWVFNSDNYSFVLEGLTVHLLTCLKWLHTTEDHTLYSGNLSRMHDLQGSRGCNI